MNNTIIDRIKLAHYKNLHKKGKFTDEYIRDNRINHFIIFMVKQDFNSFNGLTPKQKYEVLIQKQFDISKESIYNKSQTAINLFNNGYTNILNEIDFSINDNDRKQFFEYLLSTCNKNEYYYKIFIDVLNEKELVNAIVEDPNFFLYLPSERKIELAKKVIKQNSNILNNMTEEEQLELVKQEQDLISYKKISQTVKVVMIKENPFLFKQLDEEDKLLFIKNKELFKILPKEIVIQYLESLEFIKKQHVMLTIALDDINATKYYNFINNYVEYNSAELSKIFESLPDEKIVNFIIHSKGINMSALSHLTSSKRLQTSSYNNIISREIFLHFQNLSSEQIIMLMKVDLNYIFNYININDFDKSKLESIEVFKKMYGEEIFDKLSQSFDNLFEYCKSNSQGNKLDEHPLENLKILFNDKILKSCSPEMINTYYEKLNKNEDVMDDFKNIIKTAYGEKALAILESRPNLNVHSINSLEIFDERIIDNFGEAFVHNCITYNMYDFQEFLEIIKDSEQIELFKSYYGILCKVYGENVETMQRCISEFSYNKELLKNIKDVDLTTEQAKKLINVLAMSKNMLQINSIEDLDNFDKKVNDELVNILNWFKNDRIHYSLFKSFLSQNIFGLRYNVEQSDSDEVYYGDSVEKLLSLYDYTNQDGYNEDEIKIMNILTFLKNENNPSKIISFIEENIKSGNLSSRNILEINQLITKVAMKEAEKLNKEITTIEKLEVACEEEKDKPLEERSVFMEEVDGVKYFQLEGLNYSFFSHQINTSLDNVLFYEGQAGNLAICTGFTSSTINGKIPPDKSLIYGPSDAKSYISFSNNDAATDHTSKHIKMAGAAHFPISQVSNLSNRNSAYNEVAFYRVERDMSKINNDNTGGRIYPIAIVYPLESKGTIGPEILEICKKHNIAIIYINKSKYEKKNNEELMEEFPLEEIKEGRRL